MIKIDCTVQASDSWDQQSKPYFSFRQALQRGKVINRLSYNHRLVPKIFSEVLYSTCTNRTLTRGEFGKQVSLISSF